MTTPTESLSKHPTNPLVITRESLALSQDDLANSAGITLQIVAMTEAGVYSSIPPIILDTLNYDFGIDSKDLNARYKQWIVSELTLINVAPITVIERQSAVGAADKISVTIPKSIHSFREWRNTLCAENNVNESLAGFAKLIKIQAVTIRKYETGKTKSLPRTLIDRLSLWGYPQQYIAELAALPIGRV